VRKYFLMVCILFLSVSFIVSNLTIRRDLPRWASALGMYLEEPRMKAFLDVIAYAEGTSHAKGYSALYGGELFNDFSCHPRRIIIKKSCNRLLGSTAAGRYQILARSWDHYASVLHIKDFSPQNQDKIAVALIRQRGALNNVLAGEFEIAIEKVSQLWASLPGAPYKQRIVHMQQLKKIYLRQLDHYLSCPVVERVASSTKA
jgi:muramidase (phage lysozyme)